MIAGCVSILTLPTGNDLRISGPNLVPVGKGLRHMIMAKQVEADRRQMIVGGRSIQNRVPTDQSDMVLFQGLQKVLHLFRSSVVTGAKKGDARGISQIQEETDKRISEEVI